jgi:ATP-dependent DNA helicase DinG
MSTAAAFVLNQINLCSILLGEAPPELRVNANPEEVEYLRYVECQKHDNYTSVEIKTTPLDIGPLVAPGLLHIGKVIMTSATLTGTKDSWAFMTREFGLAESQLKVKMSLGSPFDYKKNSALYLSKTAPEWETVGKEEPERYYSLMADEMHELLTASRGGAFIICPSKSDMNKYYSLLHDRTGPYQVMKQTSSVDQDIENFQLNPGTVLIGVQGIGEGVDLPGTDVLRLVIIPRLPFTPPTDVVMQTQMNRLKQNILNDGGSPMEANMKAFNTYSLPDMVFKLKQWVGRLIRSNEDRGVVAILDTRIIKKRYGKAVLASLPFPIYYESPQILRFLRVLSG